MRGARDSPEWAGDAGPPGCGTGRHGRERAGRGGAETRGPPPDPPGESGPRPEYQPASRARFVLWCSRLAARCEDRGAPEAAGRLFRIAAHVACSTHDPVPVREHARDLAEAVFDGFGLRQGDLPTLVCPSTARCGCVPSGLRYAARHVADPSRPWRPGRA